MIWDLVMILLLVWACSILVWVVYMVVGDLMGAPYVPTENREISKMLSELKPEENSLFYDLGSGDGRVVRKAVGEYKVKGIGVEIHPFLVLYSKWKSKVSKLTDIDFLQTDFLKLDISKAKYIYFYLTPKIMDKLGKKILSEGKNVTVVSKAFEVKPLKEKLVKKMEISNKTYYLYRV